MSAFFKTVTLLGFSKLSFSKSGINMNTFQTFQTLLALCIYKSNFVYYGFKLQTKTQGVYEKDKSCVTS